VHRALQRHRSVSRAVPSSRPLQNFHYQAGPGRGEARQSEWHGRSAIEAARAHGEIIVSANARLSAN
jgi:hypothetical protein